MYGRTVTLKDVFDRIYSLTENEAIDQDLEEIIISDALSNSLYNENQLAILTRAINKSPSFLQYLDISDNSENRLDVSRDMYKTIFEGAFLSEGEEIFNFINTGLITKHDLLIDIIDIVYSNITRSEEGPYFVFLQDLFLKAQKEKNTILIEKLNSLPLQSKMIKQINDLVSHNPSLMVYLKNEPFINILKNNDLENNYELCINALKNKPTSFKYISQIINIIPISLNNAFYEKVIEAIEKDKNLLFDALECFKENDHPVFYRFLANNEIIIKNFPFPNDKSLTTNRFQNLLTHMMTTTPTIIGRLPIPKDDNPLYNFNQHKSFCLKIINQHPNYIKYFHNIDNYILFNDTEFFELYKKAISSAGKTDESFVSSLPTPGNKYILLSAEQYNELYLLGLKHRPEAIKYIPNPENMNAQNIKINYFELYSFAIKSKSYPSLQNIKLPSTHNRLFTRDQYKLLCINAVKENPENILYINVKEKFFPKNEYFELLKSAISKKPMLLKEPTFLKLIAPDVTIDTDQYKALFKMAIKTNGNSLLYCKLKVFSHDELKEMFSDAVTSDGVSLEGVPYDKTILSDSEYESLCLKAVIQNAAAVNYILNDEIKSTVIKKLDVVKAISDDYDNIDLFKNLSEKQLADIDTFLKNIKHIVVTGKKLYRGRSEIDDSYLVYRNSEKRKDQTIHVCQNKLQDLLSALQKANNNNKINLVLLEHANIETTNMGGLNAKGIADLLSDRHNINRVTLLGCSTIASLPLQSEIETANTYKSSQELTWQLACISHAPSDSELSTLTTVGNDKQFGSFLLVKDNINNLYQIIQVMPNKDPVTISLQKDQLDLLVTQIQKKFKFTVKFPSLESDKAAIVSKSLNEKQISFFSNDIFNENEFSNQKKIFPSLQKGIMSADEINKLNDSFAKKIIDEIKKTPSIDHPIEIKGFAKPIHVDTKEGKFIASKTHLYIDNSVRHYAKGTENIDRKKLEREHTADKKQMSSSNYKNNPSTLYKSIIVKIPEKTLQPDNTPPVDITKQPSKKQ